MPYRKLLVQQSDNFTVRVANFTTSMIVLDHPQLLTKCPKIFLLNHQAKSIFSLIWFDVWCNNKLHIAYVHNAICLYLIQRMEGSHTY